MDEDELSKYEAVVQHGWPYYAPRFERFARGGWLSWNKAAFLVTLAWLRYRRMYAWSWAYFFVSPPFLLVVTLINYAAVDACERSLDHAQRSVAGMTIFALFCLGWIVPPLVANRLYFNQVRKQIAKVDKVKGPGGGSGALALQALLVIVVGLGSPSFANYVYRAMVSEGVASAAGAKAAMQEYLIKQQRLPTRVDALPGWDSSKYVDRLALESNGTIRLFFGDKAKKLSGHSVSFDPQIKDDRIVQWSCRSVDLPQVCLPPSCR